MEKTFGLLEFLAAEGKPTSLQSITEAVGLSKPTAYRLLQSLQQLGYVARPSGSRDYLIGSRTTRLAASDPYAELKSAARPLLRKLHESLNETINLGVLSGNRVIYIDFLETTQPLRFIVVPGKSDPFYSTALGRAIASRLSEPHLDRLLEGTRLQGLTSLTVKTLHELRRKIQTARETGIAEEMEETVPGVCCLAASLVECDYPEAAVSVAVPAQRLTPRRKREIIALLKTVTSQHA